MLDRQFRKLCSILGEGRARLRHHQLRSALRRGFEYTSEVVSWIYLERLNLQIERLCSLLGRSKLIGT